MVRRNACAEAPVFDAEGEVTEVTHWLQVLDDCFEESTEHLRDVGEKAERLADGLRRNGSPETVRRRIRETLTPLPHPDDSE